MALCVPEGPFELTFVKIFLTHAIVTFNNIFQRNFKSRKYYLKKKGKVE